MQMRTYTKVFLQFPPDQQFWDADTQFFLYADPVERGWYPVWQSLSGPGFLPGSGILFATVVSQESYRAESQSDEITQADVMAVLRSMFGEDIPDPIDFLYPRWSTEPWAYGSYSNWPPSYSIEMHQNLRANLGHLYFAGEATSAEYYGFLQGMLYPLINLLLGVGVAKNIVGAYFEGQSVGNKLAGCINGNHTACQNTASYETVRGCATSGRNLSPSNGWFASSFLTWGFDD